MTLDLSRPVRTRSGAKAEILTVLPPEKAVNGHDTIVALIWIDDELMRNVATYRADGSFLPGRKKSRLDLVNTP